MKHIKCPQCGVWNEASNVHCEACNYDFHHESRSEMARRKQEQTNNMPLIRIKESDGFWQRAYKRPLQLAQLIFFGIISIIAAMASSTVH